MQRYIVSNRTAASAWPIPSIALTIATMVICVTSGFLWGEHDAKHNALSVTAELQQTTRLQQLNIDTEFSQTQLDLDALAIYLGRLQAETARLEALGQRLVQLANLDKGEFDFEKRPPLGGPQLNQFEHISAGEMVTEVNRLAWQLQHRAPQLEALESLLLYRNLNAEIIPTGRPVKQGWMSSGFGMRNDPFTGRRSRHYGVDYAGKMGGDIISAAAGIVTWSGRRSAYGNMIEVNHGNGYVTRYGHAKKLMVSAGATVEKGQVIATIGNTGRSTGPHVHFEVLRHGKLIDPLPFIRAGL